jgi:hypothetical protein
MVMVIILGVLIQGCATSKYKVMYGIADWYYTNHVTLQAQYNAATPESQAWLRANVNPYMNMMQQAVIAMGAIDKGDSVKASACASEILRIATGIKYDASKIVVAIQTKNYDALFAEALALKSFIIQKLSERR